MAIEFVVEDGTGLSNATSLTSVEVLNQWLENTGRTLTATDDQKKVLLNNATEYLCNNYNYLGYKVKDTQALCFPRSGVVVENVTIANDSVPGEIQKACCFLAYTASTEDIYTNSSNIQSESWGPVSITYKDGSANKSYQQLTLLVKKYIDYSGRMIRVN